jgi:hypothetical protein
VEVELKQVLRYMPFGVLTYPQLRREMRRCVETGAPWPFVLAVIPSSRKRRWSFAGPRKSSTRPWFQSLATGRLKPV